MGELLNHFVEDPRVCDYLPGERAALEYRVMSGVGPEELESLLVRGWRRLGPFYFRPACAGCFECVPLRIPVASFAPSRSQQRAARRARRFRVHIGTPRVDRARLDLYARWHAAREERRGWDASALGAEDYALQFAYPHEAVRELTLWDGGSLVAVSLCDVTPRAWSAIYFFYDPRVARLSPGIANPTSYDLYTYGKDGKVGGTGEDALFMIGACAAFVSYLLNKARTTKGEAKAMMSTYLGEDAEGLEIDADPDNIIFNSLPMAMNCQPSLIRRCAWDASATWMPGATPRAFAAARIVLSASLNWLLSLSNVGGNPIDAWRSFGPTNTASRPGTLRMASMFSTACTCSAMTMTRISSFARE